MEQILRIEAGLGNTIETSIIKAKELATEARNVSFEFNGVEVIVSRGTYVSHLVRDYSNAHMMEWKTVGPEPEYSYSATILFKMAELTKIREDAQAESERRYAEKAKEQRTELEDKIGAIEFDCADVEAFTKVKEKNTDEYGAGIVRYAELWARLMQSEIKDGITVAHVAKQASHDADIEGITGFMYGAAVSILSKCWKHGEELRRWHNGEYNHTGDGVVNPAVLTIGKKTTPDKLT